MPTVTPNSAAKPSVPASAASTPRAVTKPVVKPTEQAPARMTRTAFNQLDHAERNAYMAKGGKLTDEDEKPTSKPTAPAPATKPNGKPSPAEDDDTEEISAKKFRASLAPKRTMTRSEFMKLDPYERNEVIRQKIKLID